VNRFLYNDKSIRDSSSINADHIEYLGKTVRFSLRHCSTARKNCISTFAGDKEILQALYNRLGHFEKMTWQQAKGTDHAKCISIEGKNTPNHRLLSQQFPDFTTYCHMRVNTRKKPKFRVFGALQEDWFCILRFDVDGKENH
jgi:hypothetical protein